MLRTKMHAVMGEISDEVAERSDLILCIAIALLTFLNLFILGGTGQAKSYVINRFRKRIIGAKQFVYLMTKQTDEEQLFGRIDLKSYIDGNPKMITTGKIPDCHIVFQDEIFKCNDGTLNSMLTAYNEREYTNEGELVKIPVISFMSASNEIPDFNNPEDQILRPLFDRLHLKVKTDYIQSREERLRILRRKKSQKMDQINAIITLDELKQMQKEVKSVVVPNSIDELMDDILCELRRLGIHVSDRTYFEYHPIAQAKAWLDGRDTVQPSDMSVLKYYLWSRPEEIEVIQQLIERLCIPIMERIKEITQMAADSHKEFTANVGVKSMQAFKKLNGELIRLHRDLQQLELEATDTESKAAISNAVNEFEAMSEKAHKRCGYPYKPLFSKA